MNKNEKKDLEPKLRFPEFESAGKWQRKALCDLLNYERPEKYIVESTNYLDDGTPVLTANKSFILGYTSEHFGIYSNVPAIIFDDFTTDYKYVDFLFKIKSSAIKILKEKENNDLKFVFELMSTINFDPIGHKRYYISEYQHQNVYVPKLKAEQQKIADCLSSLDDLIVAEDKKLSVLKEHKKKLMQKLFPAEGKTLPEWRFPEFRDCGEWNETQLSNLCEYKNGGSFEKYVVETGKYNLITLNSIDINGTLKNDHKQVDKADWYLCKNDLVIVLSDVAHGDFLGLCDIIPKDNKYVLNQRMGLLRIDNRYNVQFIRYFINLNQRYFKLHGQGSNQKNLSKDAILNFLVKIPRHKEQQKIVDCLSSVDDFITAQAEKIGTLKAHKKGLMQGLFPSLEEVDK